MGGSVAIGATLTPWLLRAMGPPGGLVLGLALVAVLTCVFLRLVLGRLDALSPQAPVAALLDTTTRELPRIRQRRRLLRLVTRALVRGFQASHATVFLEDPATASFWLAERYGHALPTAIQQLERDSPLIRWLQEARHPLDRQAAHAIAQRIGPGNEPNTYARLHLILENLRTELIVPSFRGRRLVGLLALGPKANGHPYTEAEVAALARLAREYAVALDNARRYEDWEATARKLQSAQGRLLQQERMVAAGRLAMGLAHEIKNPLTAIKTFTEFLPERYDNPQFRQEFTQIVGSEVNRISRIVQSLADFAKPILLKIETIDVQKVLKDTATLLSNDCLKRDVKLEASFEPQPILLPGDSNQLKQAFLNLCLNALDAMGKGGTLSVSCQYQSGEAVIRISDTGTGIAKEHLPQLFDAFFSTKQSGMGLGLAVVKQIVEHHLGSIRVDSELGAGTTFEIRLPLAVRFRTLAQPSAQQADAKDAAVPRLTVPLDLVVVDDEPKMRTMLQQTFEGMGAHVRVVETGEDALQVIAQHMPQLVLLDLKLPEMDGFDVLKRLKLRYPKIPILIITGYFDETIDRYVTQEEVFYVALLGSLREVEGAGDHRGAINDQYLAVGDRVGGHRSGRGCRRLPAAEREHRLPSAGSYPGAPPRPPRVCPPGSTPPR